MSVVAHAGGWIVSVAIIAQLVRTMEAVALAASRKPGKENAAGVSVIGVPAASTHQAINPATPPIRWLPTTRRAWVRSLRRSNASTTAVGPRLGKMNGCPVAQTMAPRSVKRSPA